MNCTHHKSTVFSLNLFRTASQKEMIVMLMVLPNLFLDPPHACQQLHDPVTVIAAGPLPLLFCPKVKILIGLQMIPAVL